MGQTIIVTFLTELQYASRDYCNNIFLLPSASLRSWTTSSPSTPAHLKPLVQVVRRPTDKPSCLQGKLKVKPSGSLHRRQICSSSEVFSFYVHYSSMIMGLGRGRQCYFKMERRYMLPLMSCPQSNNF